MSVLAFIASLASSLAWPIVVLVIVLLFRAKIGGLLSDGLKRLKAGPLEMEWEHAVALTREELGQAGVPPLDEPGAALPVSEELAPLAQLSPQDAVVRGYAKVEAALRGKLAGLDIDEVDLRIGVTGLSRVAARHGLISDETLGAIQGLSVLRNLSAHGRADETTTERAMDYLALVDAVLYALR